MESIEQVAVAIRDDMPDAGALDRGIDIARRTGAALSLYVFAWDPAIGNHPFADSRATDRAIADHMATRRQWLQDRVEPLQAEGMKVHAEVIWADSLSREILRMVLATEPDLLIKDTETGPRKGWAPVDWRLLRHCPAPLMLVQPRPGPAVGRVLTAVDPMHAWGKPESLDGAILSAGRLIAGLYEAELHVGHAVEPLPALLAQHMGEGGEAVEAAHRDYLDTQRKALATACEGHSLDASRVHQREGTPAKVIADLVDDIDADLLVMGTVNRRGLKRAVIGSTAEAILDRTTADVLAIKPDGFVSDYETLKEE